MYIWPPWVISSISMASATIHGCADSAPCSNLDSALGSGGGQTSVAGDCHGASWTICSKLLNFSICLHIYINKWMEPSYLPLRHSWLLGYPTHIISVSDMSLMSYSLSSVLLMTISGISILTAAVISQFNLFLALGSRLIALLHFLQFLPHLIHSPVARMISLQTIWLYHSPRIKVFTTFHCISGRSQTPYFLTRHISRLNLSAFTWLSLDICREMNIHFYRHIPKPSWMRLSLVLASCLPFPWTTTAASSRLSSRDTSQPSLEVVIGWNSVPKTGFPLCLLRTKHSPF